MLKTMFVCALGVLLGGLLFLAVDGSGDIAGARTLGRDAVPLTPPLTKPFVPTEPSLLAQEPKPFPAATKPTAPVKKTVNLTDQHDGKTVVVNQGDDVSIKLESNPTTGFNWRVGTVSNGGAKQSGKVEFEATPLPPGSGPILGRGGHNVITFETLAPGTVTIRLEYSRPWEKAPPYKTFTVTLEIK